MKKLLAIVLTACLLLSLTACTPKEEAPGVLTGRAYGFGGVITVEVKMDGDTITDVVVVSHTETDGVGTPAIDAIPAAVIEAGTTEGVDIVADATVTSEALLLAINNAIDPEAYPFIEAGTEMPVNDEPVGEIGPGVRLGQAQYAAHGSSAFANTTVVLDGDVVVAVYIDEFQFLAREGNVPVPNGDDEEGLGANFINEERWLASKRLNQEAYSVNMADRGEATYTLLEGYEAIEAFCIGKTVAELEAIVAGTDEDAIAAVDAVASCTLVDTRGYIKSVVEAARDAATFEGLEYDGDATELELGVALYAAHGHYCFTVAAAVVDGDVILLSYIDEFQVMSGPDVVGVPNSTAGFAAYYPGGSMLVSKKVNDELYSANMASRGGSTMNLSAGWDLIKATVNGSTIAEVEALTTTADDVDAIADCTLVDEKGYMEAILAAAAVAN